MNGKKRVDPQGLIRLSSTLSDSALSPVPYGKGAWSGPRWRWQFFPVWWPARSPSYGLREVVILDVGSLDGVDIGDEYVAFFGDGSTEEIVGRIRVVLTEEETSSARIVTVEGPLFGAGTTVYLDRKMR